MAISMLKIKNFKCFSDWFEVEFNENVNILVGNNGTGKSTILEAINLGLTGLYHGKNIRNEISQYLFNKDVLKEYFDSLKSSEPIAPPEIIIEIYFKEEIASFLGDGNSKNKKASGISLSIKFDEKYSNEYEMLCKTEINSLPIEYYEVSWMSFARENITARSIPVKSAIIDSTSYTPVSGSDLYISRIVKNILEPTEIIGITQGHRIMKESFAKNETIAQINEKITKKITGKTPDKPDRNLAISVDFGNKNSWETMLVAELDNVPYNNLGKGNQCIIKTQLALSDEKIENKSILLFEEPECHLSYSNLNILLKSIGEPKATQQVIITTHSSFVSNKLGLENLILINDKKIFQLKNLEKDTNVFFKKISGYDTLRILLAKTSILVEGPSDELVLQRAYMDQNNGELPIFKGIDIISVGTTFLRFLEIAKALNLKVKVVTDNDGDIDALKEKYKDYLGENKKENIDIFFDEKVYKYEGKLDKYNNNTLEPCLLRKNSLEKMNEILEKIFSEEDKLRQYMKKNKTEVALKIFESEKKIEYPKYILEAIKE